MDCVRKIGLKAFTERYKVFCRREGYNFRESKTTELYETSKELVAVFPKEKAYKDLIEMSIKQLRVAAKNVTHIRDAMNDLASTLPEYETVMTRATATMAAGTPSMTCPRTAKTARRAKRKPGTTPGRVTPGST